MKKVLITISVLTLALPFVVHAQNPGTSAEVLNQLQNRESREIKLEARKNQFEQNKDVREGEMEARKNQFEQNKEVRRTDLDARKIEMDARKANVEVRRVEFEERRTEIQTRAEEKKTEITQKIEERKLKVEERRTKLEDKVKAKVENILENVYIRLSAVITKLNGIADRLDNKLSELETRGVDVSNSSNLLEIARQKIDTAISELEASKTALTSTLETEVSKGDVRTVVESVRSSIKEAHSALVEVIKSLKSTKAEDDNSPEDNNTGATTE